MRTCSDCKADITGRNILATRCQECQRRWRSTGRPSQRGRGSHKKLVPDKTCIDCGAAYRPVASTLRCAECRHKPKPPRPWSLRQRHPAEYNIYSSAKNRIRNPRSQEWSRYGGRGLTMCEHVETFAGFMAEVGPRPDPELSIERLDNDRGYLCRACAGATQLQWATRSEQALNRRNSTQGLRYTDAPEIIARKRAQARRYPGVKYRPGRKGKGRGAFEAYKGNRYIGRAPTARKAVSLLKAA